MNTYILTSIHNDNCDKKSEIENNEKIFNYNLSGYKNYEQKNFSKNKGIFISQTEHVNNKIVDNESSIKNGVLGNQLTNNKSKASKILQCNNCINGPYMGTGYTNLQLDRPKSILSRDNKSCTKCNKSCSVPTNICTNRGSLESTWWNMPQVNNVKKIQQVDHVIPIWQRGGINTRDFIKNIDCN